MNARHFAFYDDWKSALLTCPDCDWQGTFKNGKMDVFAEVMDISCPKCHEILAIVAYPTLEELCSNWDKLTPSEQKEMELRETIQQQFKTEDLIEPIDLPDLVGDDIRLFWDSEGDDIVIRTGDYGFGSQTIWHEREFFECYERYEEIARILKQAYGSRLTSLQPTPKTKLFLYGDSYSAEVRIAQFREKMGL